MSHEDGVLRPRVGPALAANVAARVTFKKPGHIVFDIPAKTGDEGFDFLAELERRSGGPIPDPARESRWRALMAEQKKRHG